MSYTEKQINKNILRALEEGKSNDDALDLFLMMNMVNDLPNGGKYIPNGPSPSEVHMNLVGNDVIGKDDFQLKMVKSKQIFTQKLIVKLSPTCILYAEMSSCQPSCRPGTHNYFALQVTINEKNMTSMYLRSYQAEDIALWMIRQKQNLDKYLEDWNAVLDKACKKAKGKRMDYICIRAIFSEAMKDYPLVRYEFIELKRRVKNKVMIPNTHLGVFINAWWGSYRECLPRQIESLKLIIEAHSKSTLTNFFFCH